MPEWARFARFLLTGGIAAGVKVGACWMLEAVMVYEAAVACAYLLGMAAAFVLARLFVFKRTGGAVHGEFIRFAMVNAVSFAQVWIVSVGLARLVFPAIGFGWQAETIAHVIGVLSPVATSYVLHKRFSFRPAGA